MKIITIICDDEVARSIQIDLAAYGLESITVAQHGKKRRKRKTISVGSREHKSVGVKDAT